jgi:hypothetical protein
MSSGGDSPGGGGSDGGVGGSIGTLPPFDPADLVCFGEDYGVDYSGYDGQCCYQAKCYEPASGAACASANDAASAGMFPNYPGGSGECSCSDKTHPLVVGPFAPHPTSPTDGSGRCCYLVGMISCGGRPLRVDGASLVAGVVQREDWRF